MWKAYDIILDRCAELQEELAQPDTASDPDKLQTLLKELNTLQIKADAYRAYLQTLHDLQETEALLAQPEFAELAQEEMASLREQKAQQEMQLKILLLPPDPDADRNVILEIRAGAGGDEAALFGAQLLRMYRRFAERHRLICEPVSYNMTELGGVKEAVVRIVGKGTYDLLRYESGVHRVQRVPVTEANGRTQTSTCTVAVLPEREDIDLQIDPKDLRIDVYRSTGHGGQCVNTTDSAVRITHLPTGLVVTCQNEKSQIKNRAQAMRVLQSRLYDKMREQRDSSYAAIRHGQVGSGDRSERIRTYHFTQGRVTDHRANLTLYQIDAVMDGNLDPIIEALKLLDREEQLKQI